MRKRGLALDDDLRDELLAMMRARRELSPEDEQYLADAFLDRLDREVDLRVEAKAPRLGSGPSFSKTSKAVERLFLLAVAIPPALLLSLLAQYAIVPPHGFVRQPPSFELLPFVLLWLLTYLALVTISALRNRIKHRPNAA